METKLILKGKEFKVHFGGQGKEKLVSQLISLSIGLNKYAHQILEADEFDLPQNAVVYNFVETSVSSLGFAKGATTAEIEELLPSFGLAPCPIESAPYIRLEYLDQEASTGNSSNQSPPGAIIIFSKKLNHQPDFPNGFYLRHFDGQLWLRGHRYTNDYLWQPSDIMIFRKLNPAASCRQSQSGKTS